jgi:hypothetical protein
VCMHVRSCPLIRMKTHSLLKECLECRRIDTIANSIHEALEGDAVVESTVLLPHFLSISQKVLVVRDEELAEGGEPGLEGIRPSSYAGLQVGRRRVEASGEDFFMIFENGLDRSQDQRRVPSRPALAVACFEEDSKAGFSRLDQDRPRQAAKILIRSCLFRRLLDDRAPCPGAAPKL